MRKEFQETTDIGLLNGDSVSGLSQSLKSHVLESVVREEAVSINNALHFKWGQGCDGWWLKNEGQFSVIYETMPAGSCEIKHYHQKTEQFFIVYKDNWLLSLKIMNRCCRNRKE